MSHVHAVWIQTTRLSNYINFQQFLMTKHL